MAASRVFVAGYTWLAAADDLANSIGDSSSSSRKK